MDEYPNRNPHDAEAWTPEKPEERVQAEEQEKLKVSTSIGVIKDVLQWFDTKADFYANIDALDITDKTAPQQALVALTTVKNMRAEFQRKAAEFRAEFSQYLKDADET